MTVAELISKLQEMPQGARVFVDSPHMDEATMVRKVVTPIRRPGPYYGGEELLVVVQ